MSWPPPSSTLSVLTTSLAVWMTDSPCWWAKLGAWSAKLASLAASLEWSYRRLDDAEQRSVLPLLCSPLPSLWPPQRRPPALTRPPLCQGWFGAPCWGRPGRAWTVGPGTSCSKPSDLRPRAPRAGRRRPAGQVGGGGLDGLASRRSGRRVSSPAPPNRPRPDGWTPRPTTCTASSSGRCATTSILPCGSQLPLARGGFCGDAGGKAGRCFNGPWREQATLRRSW